MTQIQYFNVKVLQSKISFQGPFVAAFASANSGDVSPNLKGPKCIDTGLECYLNQTTCGGSFQKCIAFGPGNDMKDSTYIIAEKQFQEAKVSKNLSMAQFLKYSHKKSFSPEAIEDCRIWT